MRLLLLGYGRMGRLVESLAPQYGFEVAGWLDDTNNQDGAGLQAGRWSGVDVAIDFSTAAAVVTDVPALARLGINVVIGTTGWQAHEADVRRAAAGIGVVAAPNFSTGVVLFEALAEYAGRLLGAQDDFGAWVHEAHHAKKVDAPSGTALMLKTALARGGYARPIDLSSTRAGSIPGTHTVGFDGPSETITLTHTARDRATFARGALQAARWVQGRRGWFTMRDVLGLGHA
ncbi:MAG TPA: dihydrodipicolinate reductase C-terminal domain-containing protein [Vicinamibacterales bacterium]|nr:dihydrodipicolinate reductase C-terminal domain-containing protein [Vicinamibacterales bacterium]